MPISVEKLRKELLAAISIGIAFLIIVGTNEEKQSRQPGEKI